MPSIPNAFINLLFQLRRSSNLYQILHLRDSVSDFNLTADIYQDMLHIFFPLGVPSEENKE